MQKIGKRIQPKQVPVINLKNLFLRFKEPTIKCKFINRIKMPKIFWFCKSTVASKKF